MYRARFVVAEIVYFDKGAREDGARKIKTYRTGEEDAAIHIFYWITLLLMILVGMIATFA